MSRSELLAAELYSYSYANYHDHLGIGNARFERYMPETVATLERAQEEHWPIAEIARALETDEVSARDSLSGFHRALQVIDAADPAESFRNAVRFAVRDAVAKGLSSDDAVEDLVTQICYRAADLAYLLDSRNEGLSRYSRHLRRESDVEYYDGYFDESDA